MWFGPIWFWAALSMLSQFHVIVTLSLGFGILLFVL